MKKYEVILDEKTSVFVEADDFILCKSGSVSFVKNHYNRLQDTTHQEPIAVFCFNNIKGFQEVKQNEKSV